MVRMHTAENNGFPTMVQVHGVIARNITRMTTEESELSETHRTNRSPTDNLVNQVLKVRNGHSEIDMKWVALQKNGRKAMRSRLEHAPKEIGPGLAMMAVTSLTDLTSIGFRAGGAETVTDDARVEQTPSNEKPAGEVARDNMALRLKGTTTRTRHMGIS